MKIKNFLILSLGLFIILAFASDIKAQRKKVTTSKTIVGVKGTLSIEAGLVYKSGDVKPVARTQFYLLDENLEIIISDSGVDTSKLTADSKVEAYAAMINAQNQLGVGKMTTVADIENAIKPHIIGTITTDFSGKGTFSNVKAGNYYLYGIGGTNQTIIWNLKIDLKSGKQSVILDNKNASVIY